MQDAVSSTETLDRFEAHLVASGKSANTMEAYTRDLRLVSKWFTAVNGKPLARRGSRPSTSGNTAPSWPTGNV